MCNYTATNLKAEAGIYSQTLICIEQSQCHITNKQTNKQTPRPLVRKGTMPTERPPLVGEI
jgi:hypothetical protein